MAGPVGPGSTEANERCEPRARPFVRPSIREDHQGLRPSGRATRPDTRPQAPVLSPAAPKPLATRGRSIHVVLLEQHRPYVDFPPRSGGFAKVFIYLSNLEAMMPN